METAQALRGRATVYAPIWWRSTQVHISAGTTTGLLRWPHVLLQTCSPGWRCVDPCCDLTDSGPKCQPFAFSLRLLTSPSDPRYKENGAQTAGSERCRLARRPEGEAGGIGRSGELARFAVATAGLTPCLALPCAVPCVSGTNTAWSWIRSTRGRPDGQLQFQAGPSQSTGGDQLTGGASGVSFLKENKYDKYDSQSVGTPHPLRPRTTV